jgi:hypothetical protein
MILTQELLTAVDVCEHGQQTAETYNCINLDLNTVEKIMQENNMPGYANWVRSLFSNQTALKVSKYYEYIQYLVYDPIEKHFKSTPNESDISAIKEQIILDNPDVQQSLIIAYEEIKSLDGSVYRFPIH